MFKNLLLEEFIARICYITTIATLNNVDSIFLKIVTPERILRDPKWVHILTQKYKWKMF